MAKKTQPEFDLQGFVKKWGWTLLAGGLCLLVGWQGLTLWRQMQSWDALKSRSQRLLVGEFGGKKKVSADKPKPEARTIEATFFFHPPKPSYTLTAVVADFAVINGSPVKVGGKVGDATVTHIDPEKVVLQVQGQDVPMTLDVHFGSRDAEGSDYNLTSILGDIAVINNHPVKQGDRIGKAVVQTIEGNTVTLLEEGEAAPKTLTLKSGS